MIRSLSPVGLLLFLTLASSLVACHDEPTRSTGESATPFSGEQIDRIHAGVRAKAPPDAASPDPRPLWVANELRDDGSRLVLHVRLPLRGDLDSLDRLQGQCTDVRARMREFLLPGQRVELYLVFDDSVHACRGDE